MDLTWINVADTAIKIGLGALITAVSGYLVLKQTHDHGNNKERKDRFYNLQEDRKAMYINFLSQSISLVQTHLSTSCTCDTEKYNEFLRTYSEVQISSTDEIRIAAFKLLSSVNEFIVINKNGLEREMKCGLRQAVNDNSGIFQLLAKVDVSGEFNEK
ncbi:hypothetical protein [Shewanella sp. TB4-MNA-CIBAN-0142]|jgi:hypothetical protein|uniref:hypothetical protein n=1 Tax=Shewanella sp. TB4-MNA-CIBAN-0142 TaxID=3140464 RepID=UPI00332A90E0